MGHPRNETLPKSARVRRRSEYLALGRRGRRLATRHFLLLHGSTGAGPAKLGITVTRKIGNAVVRNRIKRAVRETFRRCRPTLPAGLTVVVIARHGANEGSCSAIAGEIAPALETLAGRTAPTATRTSGRGDS